MKYLAYVVLVVAYFCCHQNECEAAKLVKDPGFQLIVTKEDPQIAVATVIAGIQTVMAIIAAGRELVRATTYKDIAALEVVPYHSELAASYGTLNAESVKKMDSELKVMIAAVNRKLEKLHQENKDGHEVKWEDYVSTMMQNPLIEKDFDGEIFRNQYKEFSKWGIAKNGITKQVVNEVHTWFANLIDDSDVLAATKINITDYANVVGCTDAYVEDFATMLMRTEEVQRSILDVGILRYPDLDNPYFKMFRIKLKAYRKTVRVTFVQRDESGIMGEYNMHKFRPRDDIIKKLRADIVDRAVSEVEDLFSF